MGGVRIPVNGPLIPVEVVQRPPGETAISALSFVICQGILIQRMLRKRYRSFRIEVVRKDGFEAQHRSISTGA